MTVPLWVISVLHTTTTKLKGVTHKFINIYRCNLEKQWYDKYFIFMMESGIVLAFH